MSVVEDMRYRSPETTRISARNGTSFIAVLAVMGRNLLNRGSQVQPLMHFFRLQRLSADLTTQLRRVSVLFRAEVPS